MSKEIIPVEHIESKILTIRGRRVILDADLAAIYGVPTRRLNEQVKRNIRKFPPDFIFRLTNQEIKHLRSQIVILKDIGMRSQFATASKRNIRFLPYVFTEHGAIMAANVLNSQRALIPPFVKRGREGDFHSGICSFRNPHSLRARFQPVGLTGRRPHSVYPEMSRGAIIFAL